jgi:hypothetical protein
MATAEVTVATIAASLKAARGQHKRPVLFLGSRTGGLYRNENLYETLKVFSFRRFDSLSNLEKFEECHKILYSKYFNEDERYHLMMSALSSFWYREEDKILATLVRDGLFDAIVTTRIDLLLEEAYMIWDMKEPNDYQVITQDTYSDIKPKSGFPMYGRIIKIFSNEDTGDESPREGPITLSEHMFKQFVKSKLTDETLIIGYDALWDKVLEQVIPTNGGKIWYINEEIASLQDTQLSLVLKERDSRFLIGNQGNYSSFFKTLYYFLDENISWERAVAPLDLPSVVGERRNVFICCSQKDEQYLEQLTKQFKHLKAYEKRKELLDVWDDAKIASHVSSVEGMKTEIAHVRIALLLVSADFLASDSICEYGLPALLDAAKKGEITLISVLLGPCAFTRTPLNEYEVVNSISQPLIGMQSYEQDMVWAKIMELVESGLDA